MPLIDLQDRYGSYAVLKGYGVMSDSLHPNPSGYGDVARAAITTLAL